MKIAILCSGGDAPGMNYALYEIAKKLKSKKQHMLAVQRGFQGLVDGDIKDFDFSCSRKFSLEAGTFIKSSRSEEFITTAGFKKALSNIKKHSIEMLVVIGGNGSLEGTKKLAENGVKVAFIPATIDNDLQCTDNSLGFETAIFAAIKYIKIVMRTMASFERGCVFEVMGRHSPAIAKRVYNNIGDYLVCKDQPLDILALVKQIKKDKKESPILILQENILPYKELALDLSKKTNRTFKADDVGYVQRGTNPIDKDISLAQKFADLVCSQIINGKTNFAVICKKKVVKTIQL